MRPLLQLSTITSVDSLQCLFLTNSVLILSTECYHQLSRKPWHMILCFGCCDQTELSTSVVPPSPKYLVPEKLIPPPQRELEILKERGVKNIVQRCPLIQYRFKYWSSCPKVLLSRSFVLPGIYIWNNFFFSKALWKLTSAKNILLHGNGLHYLLPGLLHGVTLWTKKHW